jgi:hypothetical protein
MKRADCINISIQAKSFLKKKKAKLKKTQHYALSFYDVQLQEYK